VERAHVRDPLQRRASASRLILDAGPTHEQHANDFRASISRGIDERRIGLRAVKVGVCPTLEEVSNEAIGAPLGREVEGGSSLVLVFGKGRLLRHSAANGRVDRRTVREQGVDDVEIALLESGNEGLEQSVRVAGPVDRLEPVFVDCARVTPACDQPRDDLPPAFARGEA